MLQCDVTDIRTELRWIEQRLAQRQGDFTELVASAPCVAMSLMERIAADRARHLHLTLLERGLSSDYDTWARQTMDQRMCEVGWCQVSRRRPLYLRRGFCGLDLSDLFSTVHVEPYDLDALIAGIRQ
jgi:hypothetical protein